MIASEVINRDEITVGYGKVVGGITRAEPTDATLVREVAPTGRNPPSLHPDAGMVCNPRAKSYATPRNAPGSQLHAPGRS